MRKLLLLLTTALSLSASAQERRLYIKPHLNFQFPLGETIRQDYLPYAKIRNNRRSAVIMPGIRFEYIKANGNGYFFNFGTVPVGYAVGYSDYVYRDLFYTQRAVTTIGVANPALSKSNDAWVFDVGFINRLATVALFRKIAFDMKVGYGATIASFRPYYCCLEFSREWVNSMGKSIQLFTSTYPLYDPNKSKFGLMVPFKLDLNIKNKVKNVELLNLEVAYWHSFTRSNQSKITYYNVTDNVVYDNVVESKGTTWQLSVQIPLRIKRIGKMKF